MIFSISCISATDIDLANDTQKADLELTDNPVDDGKFSTLQNKINGLNDSDTLYLNNDYLNDNLTDKGIIISKNINIEGNGYTLDGLNKSRIFTITNSSKVTLNNINFINGLGKNNGGAIYFDNMSDCIFTNLKFMNNFAENHGGAIYIDGNCNFNTFTNVTFTNNTALRGGGIYINESLIGNTMNIYAIYNRVNIYSGGVFFTNGIASNNKIKGTFINNSAPDHCSPVMHFMKNTTGNLFEGYFENNTCTNAGGVMTIMGTASNNTFKGKFYKNSAVYGGVLYLALPSYNNTITGEFINNTAFKYGGAIYFRETPSNTIANTIFINNKAPSKELNVIADSTTFKVTLIGNNTVANAFYSKDITNLTFVNVTYWGEKGLVNSADVLPTCQEEEYGQNITLEIYKGTELKYSLTKITNKTGDVLFNYPNLDPGTYTYLIYHPDDSYYTYINQTGTMTIPKINTKLTLSNTKITYNTGKSVIITLKDKNNKKIANTKIKVKIGGKTSTKTTDKNGQVKLSNLAPKTYSITVTFNGNEKYAKSTVTSKIIVKKANSKLTAKYKAFNVKTKTKKYTVFLKNNKNKAMKNKKVSLKVKGKTYYAKTNYKGKAIFKITKLNKRGKYTAIVKFAGDNYFKGKTVKPKIRIR